MHEARDRNPLRNDGKDFVAGNLLGIGVAHRGIDRDPDAAAIAEGDRHARPGLDLDKQLRDPLLQSEPQVADSLVSIDVEVVGPRTVGENDPQVVRRGLVGCDADAAVEVLEQRGVGKGEWPSGEAANVDADRELQARDGLDVDLARRGDRGEFTDLRVELELLVERLERP